MPVRPPDPPPPPQPALREHFVNPSNDRVLRDYLFDVEERHRPVQVLSLRAGQEDRPDHILDVYVVPGGAERRYSPEEMDALCTGTAAALSTPGAFPPPQQEPPGTLPESLLTLLATRPRAVVLGDPGSGKSTLTAWFAAALANVRTPALPPEFFWMIPVPIILKDVARDLSHTDWSGLTWQDLLDAFLNQKVAEKLRGHEADFRAWCRTGQVFFLLDGLDEVSDPDKRRAIRQAVWDGMKEHLRCRWLITSRLVGYEEAAVDFLETLEPARVFRATSPDPEQERLNRLYGTKLSLKKHPDLFLKTDADYFKVHTPASLLYITPFDDARMRRFLEVWMPARVGPVKGEEKVRDLWKRFVDTPPARIISRMPIVLVFAAQVYLFYGVLPQGRTRLYDRITEAYSGTIIVNKGLALRYTPEEVQIFLARVGWELQCLRRSEDEPPGDEASGGDGLVATTEQLHAWLGAELEKSGAANTRAALEEFIDYITRVTGLLLPRGGENLFGFTHLSFQEYYAALYLENWWHNQLDAASDGDLSAAESFDNTIKNLAEMTAWQEVFIFLAERLSYQVARNYPARLLKRLGLTEPQPPEVLAQSFETIRHDPDAHSDPVSPDLAALAARLSVNPFVLLGPADRTRLWHRLWRWQLWWDASNQMHAAGISSLLLSGPPLAADALAALAGATNASDIGATFLWFFRCPGLTGTLDGGKLPAGLKDLWISHCASVTGVAAPPPGLTALMMESCPAVTQLDQFPDGFRRLEVNYCPGLTQITGLPPTVDHLQVFHCPALKRIEPLPEDLKNLWIDDCEALGEEVLKRAKTAPDV